MARKIIFWSIGILIVVLAIVGFFIDRQHRQELEGSATKTTHPTVAQTPSPNVSTPTTNTAASDWLSPLGDPKTRVTKKTFGLYVTPQNSPVQPEKFTGYHTGWDFETTAAEANSDVAVTAFCAGNLKLKEWASGYGGVAVESCTLQNQAVTVIYGHLNIDTVTAKANDQIGLGDKIGLLGAGFSHETDGERKHLHFGIHKGTVINIKGYATSPAELAGWADPSAYLGKL